MAAEDRLERGSATFILRRHPHRPGSSLRAWDAADLMLLDAVDDLPEAGQRLLLVGDRQGALATVLAPRARLSMLDSIGGRIATTTNLERNHLDGTGLTFTEDLSAPAEVGELATLVLMKLPRSNDLLELRLRRLALFAPPGTPVWAGVMARRLSSGAIRLFERLLGPVEVSRAVRKARVLRSQVAPGPEPIHTRSFDGPDGLRLISWPSVFGAGRLDKGAAALLAHIPTSNRPLDVVDFGCGGGVLGLVTAGRAPAARLTFVDDSALAIDSSRRSWQANHLEGRSATFLHADDLGGLANASVDLVLCNPPFHQEHALSRQTAAAMFDESRRVLRSGGALLVVGNRHLHYDDGMRRRFNRVRVLASDRRFAVIRAQVG